MLGAELVHAQCYCKYKYAMSAFYGDDRLPTNNASR